MRLDKFLKVSRIIKRREQAHDFILLDKVLVNDKVAKPATAVKEGDIITLMISPIRTASIKVLKIKDFASTSEAPSMYEELSDTKEN